MKRYLLIIAMLISSVVIMAQAPQSMNFQALVRNASNELVTNQQVTIEVSVVNSSNDEVYKEQQSVMTNENGVATMVIGEGTPLIGAFSEIVWSADSYKLLANIKTDNDENEYSGVTPLLSVPYSLYAERLGKDYYRKSEIDALIVDLKKDVPIGVPTVKTLNGNISPTSAEIIGNVVSANGAAVTERGICWGTEYDPTVENKKIPFGSGTGYFIVSISSSLSQGTTYYARAYAINSYGIAYGENIAFSPATKPSAPTVKTGELYIAPSGNGYIIIDNDVVSDNGNIVTERGICWNTTGNPTISDYHSTNYAGTGTGKYRVVFNKGNNWDQLLPNTKYYVRAYAKNTIGVGYGETKIIYTSPTYTIKDGALQAEFSVSDTKKVYFSQGNLQYQASTDTWRFAEKQYISMGKNNLNASSTYTGWIDLFGFATSGYNQRYPYMTSTDCNDYKVHRTSIAGTNYDWGIYNKISNGGNKAGLWRTLTNAEWKYLINRNSGELCARGRVNGVYGLIILPDEWITPPPSLNFNSSASDWSTNSYSVEDWNLMQLYGAVFLPATGCRVKTSIEGYSFYWSTDIEHAGGIEGCYGGGLVLDARVDAYFQVNHYGSFVRLVQDVK